MVEPGGPGVPDHAFAVTAFVGAPIPVAALGRGSLLVVPYARPGVRMTDRDSASGFHEVGVTVMWSSFPM